MPRETMDVSVIGSGQRIEQAHDAGAVVIERAWHAADLFAAMKKLRLLTLAAISTLVYSHLLAWGGLTDISDIVMITAFAAAAVSSIAGFAFSAICGAVLFHLHLGQVSIVQTMMVCSIGIQTYMVAALWRDIKWHTITPFLVGGVVGLPVGLTILLHTSRTLFSSIMGILLCVYSLYMLLRRPIILPPQSRTHDALIGFIGGITGGAAAFPGAPVTVWCQMFGWHRDQQRCIYQPFILIMQVLALTWMLGCGKGAPAGSSLLTAGLAIPPALAGTVIGLRWYRGLSDRQFMFSVNLLLLFSGAALLA